MGVRMSKHHGDSLGLTLSQPSGRGHVLVSRLTPTVANASLRGQLMQGSAIYEIATSQTGGAFTPVLDVHEVATMLREADGSISSRHTFTRPRLGPDHTHLKSSATWSRLDDTHEPFLTSQRQKECIAEH